MALWVTLKVPFPNFSEHKPLKQQPWFENIPVPTLIIGQNYFVRHIEICFFFKHNILSVDLTGGVSPAMVNFLTQFP